MFVFYSTHYPKPGQEEASARMMRQFDELIKQQPGVIFVSDIFHDPARGGLTGYTFWESQAAWAAAWPVLVRAVPSGDWEIKPPEVVQLNSAP